MISASAVAVWPRPPAKGKWTSEIVRRGAVHPKEVVLASSS